MFFYLALVNIFIQTALRHYLLIVKKHAMRKKVAAAMVGLMLLSTNTFAVFGTETWNLTIVMIPCSASGGAGLHPGGAVASIEGAVTVAHYPGKVKSCPGWSGLCFGAGETVMTSTTPSSGCH